MSAVEPLTNNSQYDPMLGPVENMNWYEKSLDWNLNHYILYQPPSPPTKLNKKTVRVIKPATPPDSEIPISIHRSKKRRIKPLNRAVIFSYGNGGDLGAVQPILQKLADRLHVTVIGYDYLGYGTSRFGKEGKPASTEGIELSLEAVYNYTIEKLNYQPSEVVLLGHSMGTAAALSVARKVKVGGTILISAFKSIFKAHSFTNWCCFSRADYMRNFEMVKETVDESPVFLIHGKSDWVIPIQNSIFLSNAIKDTKRWHPPFWVEGFGHNDILDDKGLAAIQSRTLDFLESLA